MGRYLFRSWNSLEGDLPMKDLCGRLSLVLMLVLFAQMAHTQAAPAKDADPKPPSSASQTLLDGWNDVGRRLIAMAEDFPEDKYDFRPSPTQRTFAEQLLHAAGGNYFFIDHVKDVKPTHSGPKGSDPKTKAVVVEYLKQSFADGAALIKSKGDSGLNDLWVNPYYNREVRFSDGAWEFIEHCGEHYGQLVVYYRVSGLVPPESRPRK
jgi:hypothetical protein